MISEKMIAALKKTVWIDQDSVVRTLNEQAIDAAAEALEAQPNLTLQGLLIRVIDLQPSLIPSF